MEGWKISISICPKNPILGELGMDGSGAIFDCGSKAVSQHLTAREDQSWLFLQLFYQNRGWGKFLTGSEV